MNSVPDEVKMYKALEEWGMSPDEDAGLRLWFTHKESLSEETQRDLHWMFDRDLEHPSLHERLFRDIHQPAPLKQCLSPFMLAAFGLTSAHNAFSRFVKPPDGDGEAFQRWILEGSVGALMVKFLYDLALRHVNGTLSTEEAVHYDLIKQEVDAHLFFW